MPCCESQPSPLGGEGGEQSEPGEGAFDVAQNEPALLADCEADPVHFMERRPGQCAWPLWDEADSFENKLCCGAPVSSGSYCAAHASVAGRAANEAQAAAWTAERKQKHRARMLRHWGSAA